MKRGLFLIILASVILLIILFGFSIKHSNTQQDEKIEKVNEISKTSLGSLCSGEEECRTFCLSNMGRCTDYCNTNLENPLCSILLANNNQLSSTFSGETQQDEKTKNCVSNPRPLFTSPFTDKTKIQEVSQIGSNAFYNPGSQARSYVSVKKGEITPVYSPVNATITRLHYSNKNYPNLTRPEYRIDFRVSCEVTFAFDHIVEVVDKIKEKAPQIPANRSNQGKDVSISVQAGELIGYTSGTIQAGTWDFVFMNSAHEAPHLNPIRWTTDHSKHADCPYDYFTDKLKEEYYALIQKKDNTPVTCGPLVRDIPNTIAGSWFQGNATESQGNRFAIYEGKHFVELISAKEGFPFFFVRDTNPSRIDPETVTTGKSACYHDAEKNLYAYLKLLSNEELALSTSTGSCPSSFPENYEVWIR